MKVFFTTIFCFLLYIVGAQTPNNYYVEIKTSAGTMIVRLFNETPLHRDNFIKLVSNGYYDDLLFHRVINNFMIQGGDPLSKNDMSSGPLGSGGPEYTIPAEFNSEIFHSKGALAAARDNNPEKSSSGSQFYIVQGKKFSPAGLDSLEEFRMKGVKFSEVQRKSYMDVGGAPHLDRNYTVFGQTISGLDVIDKLASVPTNDQDRPIINEKMNIRLLTKKEALNVERKEKGLKPKKIVFGGSKSYKLKK